MTPGRKIYATERIEKMEDVNTKWKIAAIYFRDWEWFGDFASDAKKQSILQSGLFRETCNSPAPPFSGATGSQLTSDGERWHLYVRAHPHAGKMPGQLR